MTHPEQSPSESELSPLVDVLSRRFIQRWDKYPIQLEPFGRYMTIAEPLHVGLLMEHLRGKLTLGTYLLNPNSQGRLLVFDADDAQAWHQVEQAALHLAQDGCLSYLEPSRRGGHWWLFFDRLMSGTEIRRFGQGVAGVYKLDSVELYPKQAELGDGPGSLMRLPFGIHRLSGRRYGFLHLMVRP